MPDPHSVAAFWARCRTHVADLPEAPPEAWAFGATAEHADELLSLVLSNVKTATASALWDYEAAGEALPDVGDLSILLDGRGEPRAVIRTASVEIAPFPLVTAEHAHREGEGDRSFAHWREVHEAFWRAHSENPRGFEPAMPVVCGTFELVYPA